MTTSLPARCPGTFLVPITGTFLVPIDSYTGGRLYVDAPR